MVPLPLSVVIIVCAAVPITGIIVTGLRGNLRVMHAWNVVSCTVSFIACTVCFILSVLGGFAASAVVCAVLMAAFGIWRYLVFRRCLARDRVTLR